MRLRSGPSAGKEAATIHIPILVEPLEGGRFRAHAGQPFVLADFRRAKDDAEQSGHFLMTRSVKDIGADFDALTGSDFDYAIANSNGCERLQVLCDEMRAVNEITAGAPVLFRTMERLDGADIGNPGPLVHTLEAWRRGYELFLRESVHRKPTPHSAWMINRILNATPPDLMEWLELLRGIAKHPAASGATRALAAEFVQHQARR